MPHAAPHILYIASWYPHAQAPTQGIFIQRHAQTAALDHAVTVVFAYPDAQLTGNTVHTDVQQHGALTEIRVTYSPQTSGLPLLATYRKSRRYINAIRTGVAEAIMRNGAPALLHLHVIWRGAVAVLPLLRELNVPLLITEHWSGYLPEDGNYTGLLIKRYTEKIVRSAKHITVVSEPMQKAMQQHGLHNTFSLLHNVVDTHLFSPIPVAVHETPFQLVHVSSLTDREKNVSGLLRVMQSLLTDLQVVLTIIGDGPARAHLEAQAATLGLLNETVFFRGAQPPETVAAVLQQSHALVLFSHFEGMPCVIAEAQACGLPVLATAVGGVPQMVNAAQGLLAEPGHEADLRRNILTMHQQYATFDRAAIRAHAVNTYSIEAVRHELQQLYSPYLAPHARR